MAAIAFPDISSSVRLPTGVTYSYVHVKPSSTDGDKSKQKPYILFLHGFPSSTYDWRHQISFFSAQGYGIIAPDVLGYGGTDKPKEIEAYKLKKMCEEVIGILDHEKIDKVHGVGHDWGCLFMSRMPNYHPSRFLSFAFLDVGYSAPGETFNIDAVNEETQKALGYPIFGYWPFFNSEDAAELMERNPKVTNSLLYNSEPQHYIDNFCRIGAARSFLTAGKTTPLPPYVTASHLELQTKILYPPAGGFTGPLNWYKCQMAHLNDDDEATVPEERKFIEQPTLQVTCSKDVVALPAMMEEMTRKWAKDVRMESLNTGHWLYLEMPDEVNTILKRFFEEVDE